jgi:hypothetical protein
VAEDVYFGRHKGEHCGLTRWEAAPLATGEETPMQFLKSLDLVTKTFATEKNAYDYYWRFWGRHMHEPVPYQLLMDMTMSTPLVGTPPPPLPLPGLGFPMRRKPAFG